MSSPSPPPAQQDHLYHEHHHEHHRHEHPLKVSSLKVMTDSLTIGPMHSQVLRQKVKELDGKVEKRVRRLDEEAQEYRECHDLSNDPAMSEYTVMRRQQQEQVDKELQQHQQTIDRLFNNFQKEWEANPTCEAVPPESSTLELQSRYLAESLGLALQSALSEVVMMRPDDPIDYLAHWLYRHAMEKTYKKQKAIDGYLLRIEEEEDAVAQEKMMGMRRERDRIRAEERRRKELFLQRAKEAEEEAARIQMKQKETETETTPDTMQQASESNGELTLPSELSTIQEKENSGLMEQSEIQNSSLTDSAKLRQLQQQRNDVEKGKQEEQEDKEEMQDKNGHQDEDN